jgi:hypothetical protein
MRASGLNETMEGRELIRFVVGSRGALHGEQTIPAHAALAAAVQRGFDSRMMRRIPFFAASVLSVVAFGCGGSDSPAQSTGATSGTSTTSSGGVGGSGGAGGSGGSAAGTGGSDFVVGAHPKAPQVVNLGGPVLKTPKLIAITYDEDVNQGEIDKFATELAASSYWAATTSEYGVGPLTIGAPIHITTPAPKTITDAAFTQQLKTNLSGANPAWGKADANAVYTFVLPEGSTIDSGGVCCDGGYDAYHDELAVAGTTVAYSVVCTCPGFDGPGINTLGSVTTALSHETIEAVTDPFVQSKPAFGATADADIGWSQVTEGELADMCEFDADQYLTPADMHYLVQRSWSNAAAAAGKDPCVLPSIPADVYFNSAPVMTDTVNADWYFGTVKATGVKIPIGQTKTIDVQLWSDAPTSGPWQVAAYDYGEAYNGKPNLKLTFDKTSGNNGDVLKLTIQVLQADPDFASEPFYLESTLGNASNIWMGVVGQ